MKSKDFIKLCVAVFVGIMLMGCAPSDHSQGLTIDSDISYPAGMQQTGYPIVQEPELGYPINEPQGLIVQGPLFKINTPVAGGDQIVEGSGPAGVPIILIDVSEMGLVLSKTVIDQNGSFRFSLTQPLKSGNSIGIQLGDISGTDLNENDFLYGDTYYVRPLIGTLFDMVSVE